MNHQKNLQTNLLLFITTANLNNIYSVMISMINLDSTPLLPTVLADILGEDMPNVGSLNAQQKERLEKIKKTQYPSKDCPLSLTDERSFDGKIEIDSFDAIDTILQRFKKANNVLHDFTSIFKVQSHFHACFYD